MAIPVQKPASLPPLEDRLNDVIPGYRDHLDRQGLGPTEVRALTGTARHIVTWMHVNGIGAVALDIRRVAEFASHDRACPGRLQPPTSWGGPATRQVALWLGHANQQTTEIHLRIDPAEKLGILPADEAPGIGQGSFPGVHDELLAMLDGMG